MVQPISAADANRSGFRLLREVRDARSRVVTAQDTPAARIIPCNATRSTAHSALLQRLSAQTAINVGLLTRSEVYER